MAANETIAPNFTCCSDDPLWSLIFANWDNLSALHTLTAPPWVSTSNFRGTMSILQSCMLTLFACIYTAIHINVPEKTDWLSVLWTKVKWTLLALLAPEIVLYSAASQYLAARKLRDQLRELQAESPTANKELKISLSYAFFVVMGGVHIEGSRIARFLSPGDMDWEVGFDPALNTVGGDKTARVHGLSNASLALTPKGIYDLCKRGFWVNIPESRIDASSKADHLQKGLVMFQVTWMVLQCSVRRGYGLPLSLLEIHTMVHVVCAVILYVFWLEKPLDVRLPETLRDPSWDNALALLVQKTLYYRQLLSMYKYNISFDPKSQSSNESDVSGESPARPTYQDLLGAIQDDKLGDREVARSLCRHFNCPVLPSPQWYRHRHNMEDGDAHSPEALERFRAIGSLHESTSGQLEPNGYADLCEWELGITASFESTIPDGPHLSRKSQASFALRTRDISNLLPILRDPLQTISDLFSRPALLLLTLALPLAYGGIHLSAWSYEFPTVPERLSWIISAIGVAGALPSVLVVGFSLIIVVYCVMGCSSSERVDDWVDYVGRGMCYLLLVFYVAARVFIVVESFISLRHVPVGVYWAPAWIQMIPHL